MERFQRFKTLFKPLEDHIHYYLLQLPPTFTDLTALERFLEKTGTDKIAVEFRHPGLFTNELITWGKHHQVLLVSIDAPQLPQTIMSTQVIYERIHGRTAWYSYSYSDQELHEIQHRIFAQNPKTIYIFFNNTEMLPNAQKMSQILHK